MDTIRLREFYERVIDERDRQYDQRFRAAEIALSAALSAQEKAVAAAFLASEKAIIKAEEAQKDYNIRSNEFRGQLDDQAKTLMPRPETVALFKAMDEKLLIAQNNYENRLEGVKAAIEKSNDDSIKALAEVRLAMTHLLSTDAYEARHTELQRQVNELREARSEISGKSAGANALWGYLIAIAGIALVLIFHFVK